MDPKGVAAYSVTSEAHDPRGLASRSPLFAAVGGCVFAVFWMAGVFKVSVPWMISLPIHAFAMVTLAAGVIVLQNRQTEGRAEEGWTWLPALGVAVSVRQFRNLLDQHHPLRVDRHQVEPTFQMGGVAPRERCGRVPARIRPAWTLLERKQPRTDHPSRDRFFGGPSSHGRRLGGGSNGIDSTSPDGSRWSRAS